MKGKLMKKSRINDKVQEINKRMNERTNELIVIAFMLNVLMRVIGIRYLH